MRIISKSGVILALLSCAALAAADVSKPSESSKQFYDSSGGTAPFSGAVRAGNLLFLAGALGIRDRKLAEGGTGPETALALENIKARLDQHGLTMADVVKCTVFLADIADFAVMNEVYMKAFAAPRPARSALGVSGLALNARVEIECIAAY
ncbi:MAG TPA: RidA family protein [Woeseiaceae bacterium]|nr:RidA family protein [Woeseiaceae bacterium]